jgi:hypothetical protein
MGEKMLKLNYDIVQNPYWQYPMPAPIDAKVNKGRFILLRAVHGSKYVIYRSWR